MEKQLVTEFIKLGCKNQRNAIIAFHIYMELWEVKRLHDVEYHYNKNLGLMCLSAKDSKSEPASIYIPMAASENISFSLIDSILEISRTDPNESKSVYLAIVSADSTSVYYQISEGLTPILASTAKSEKKPKLDVEFSRRRDELIQSAYLKQPMISSNMASDIPSSSSVTLNNS